MFRIYSTLDLTLIYPWHIFSTCLEYSLHIMSGLLYVICQDSFFSINYVYPFLKIKYNVYCPFLKIGLTTMFIIILSKTFLNSLLSCFPCQRKPNFLVSCTILVINSNQNLSFLKVIYNKLTTVILSLLSYVGVFFCMFYSDASLKTLAISYMPGCFIFIKQRLPQNPKEKDHAKYFQIQDSAKTRSWGTRINYIKLSEMMWF